MVNKYQLEPWVPMQQAVAWVVYRDVQAVEQASTRDGLAAISLWGGTSGSGAEVSFGAFQLPERLKRSRWQELKRALSEGSVTAEGQRKDGLWIQIRPVEWSTLPIAPLDIARQHPYCDIRMRSDDLLRKWPIQPDDRSAFDKQSARAVFDRLEATQPGLSQKQMGREIRAEYEREVSETRLPSESTFVRWVREWRELG